MAKTFDTLLTEFIAANDKKILDNPDRFKSLFLDFSQNQCRAEAMVFSQFLASPQAAELKNTDYADSAVLKNSAERFHQAYLFDKNTCELVVNAYAQVLGLDKKKPEPEIVTEKAAMAESAGKADNAGTVPAEKDFKSLFMDKRFRIVAAVFVGIVVIAGVVGYKAMERRYAETAQLSDADIQEGEVPAHISPSMVHIQSGTFTAFNYYGQSILVTVNSFFMSQYPVTQREYQEVMGTNPSRFRGSNLPVEMVDCYKAIEYCNQLSLREGLTPVYTITGTSGYRIVTWDKNANGYRLPTDAEWEHAFFAGNRNWDDFIRTSQGNFGNVKIMTTDVGSFPPNSWDLYDMHGNVWEWVWEDYMSDFGAQITYSVVTSDFSSSRLMYGGSWTNDTAGWMASSDNRVSNDIGFRLARNAQ